MSHWKKFKSDVLSNVDMDILQRASEDVGVRFDTNIRKINNPWGKESVSAGLINLKTRKRIPLGYNFKTVAGKTQLELSGDFYSTGLNEKTFIDRLAQNYQKHHVQSKLEEQGWAIDVQSVSEKGEIILEAVSFG